MTETSAYPANGALTVTGTVWPGVGDSGTLTIAEGATLALSKLSYAVAADGSCGRLKVAGVLDLSEAEITVDAPERAQRGVKLIEAGQIVGVPRTDLAGRYGFSVSGGSVRFARLGTIVILQ
jgi:hypothetical protein